MALICEKAINNLDINMGCVKTEDKAENDWREGECTYIGSR